MGQTFIPLLGEGGRGKDHRTSLHAITRIIRNEGFFGIYNGWVQTKYFNWSTKYSYIIQLRSIHIIIDQLNIDIYTSMISSYFTPQFICWCTTAGIIQYYSSGSVPGTVRPVHKVCQHIDSYNYQFSKAIPHICHRRIITRLIVIKFLLYILNIIGSSNRFLLVIVLSCCILSIPVQTVLLQTLLRNSWWVGE